MEIPEYTKLICEKIKGNKHLDLRNKTIVLHILKRVFQEWREDEKKGTYDIETAETIHPELNNDAFNFLKDTIFGGKT